MRTIERTTQFKRDYKRISKGPHRDVLGEDFVAIITALSEDQPLDQRHHDHPLTANGMIIEIATSDLIWC